MSDRAMLDIAASVWGEKIGPMQATIDRQLSAISELQAENERLREALIGLLEECEEYVRINHLRREDGSPATTPAMRHARATLAKEAGQ